MRKSRKEESKIIKIQLIEEVFLPFYLTQPYQDWLNQLPLWPGNAAFSQGEVIKDPTTGFMSETAPVSLTRIPTWKLNSQWASSEQRV